MVPDSSKTDLPNPGIKPRSLALQADSLPIKLSGKPLLLKQSNLSFHISWCDLGMDFKYKVGKPFTIPCYFVTLTIYLHKEVIVLK